MADLDSLTDSQRAALEQVQSITQSSDFERDISILKSAGWDVQTALQRIFDGEPSARSTPAPSMSTIEPMELDDSSQNEPSPPRRVYPAAGPRVGLSLYSIVTWPVTLSLNILSSLLNYIFRILRVPFPRLFTYSPVSRSSSSSARRRRSFLAGDPKAAADRFVRDLEEETGAMSMARASAEVVREGEPGPSRRRVGKVAEGKVLPDFYLGSYDSALKLAQRETKVLCAILVSEEHDDVPEFKRTVLTDPEFVRTLMDNRFIVWGGDIRDRDAYEASIKLSATTYPFVAFVSLHPRPASRNSSPQLTVISRHEGPPQNSTSVSTLISQITGTVIPRVTPLLNRLREEERVRQYERELRAEQDRAFREAERRDRERILQRREEERLRKEAEERAKREAEEQAKHAERRMHWRRYARKTLVPPADARGSIRIGVRMPSGARVVRHFNPDQSLDVLYALVDSQLIPAQFSPSDDPSEPPTGYEQHEWDFKLASTYPRVDIPWAADKTIGQFEALKTGANLIVEMTRVANGNGNGNGNGADSDDEYESE